LAGFWAKSFVLFLKTWALWFGFGLRGLSNSNVEIAGELSIAAARAGVFITVELLIADLNSDSHWFLIGLRPEEPLL